MENYVKVLGSASYEAHWVQRSSLVRLTARGLLPCSNYMPQLEQRPERIIPPMWDMVFYVPSMCEERVRYFEESVTMANSDGAKTISVRDASGTHDVPIKHQFVADEAAEVQDNTGDEQFMVYAKVPRPDEGHKGCILVPADSIVTAIHYAAFGPASRDDCEAFLLENCNGPANKFRLASGEIPWPLAV